MLNDQQIELAARKLCEMRGLDSDATYRCSDYRRFKRISNWEAAVPEIAEELSRRQVDEAIAFVSERRDRWCERCEHSEKWHQLPCELCSCSGFVALSG